MKRLTVGIIGFKSLYGKEAIGGIETWVKEVAFQLDSDRIKTIRAYSRAKYDPDKVAGDAFFKYLPTGGFWTKELETISHSLLATVKAIMKCDVIHYHGNLSAFWCFLPRLFGRTVLTTLHGADWERRKWGPKMQYLHKLSLKIAFKYSNKVISVSLPLANKLQNKFGCEVEFIPNGGSEFKKSEEVFCDKKDGEVHVGYLGRFVPEKRIEDLVIAFKYLPENYRLSLVGEAPYMGSYIQEIKKVISQEKNIEIHPAKIGKEKYNFLQKIDVLVLPSEVEGMSITLIEAAKNGLPVIASDIPENRWLIEKLSDSPNRYLFETHSPDQIASRICDIQIMGSCQKWDENLDNILCWERIADMYSRAYCETRF